MGILDTTTAAASSGDRNRLCWQHDSRCLWCPTRTLGFIWCLVKVNPLTPGGSARMSPRSRKSLLAQEWPLTLRADEKVDTSTTAGSGRCDPGRSYSPTLVTTPNMGGGNGRNVGPRPRSTSPVSCDVGGEKCSGQIQRQRTSLSPPAAALRCNNGCGYQGRTAFGPKVPAEALTRL